MDEIKKELNKDALTKREKEYLILVSKGLSNDEISNRLTVTKNTVKETLKIIYDKLNTKNKTQAATKAIAEGIIITDEIVKYDLCR